MRDNKAEKLGATSGFTLLELMIVVLFIGIIAGFALPNYVRATRNARIARTASELKSLAVAFVAYKAAYGAYPPDSHLTLPPGMSTFIRPSIWADGIPIGGTYNWEGPDGYPYAGLAIFASGATQQTLETLDNMLDDGNLAVGKFRLGTGGRPTYIIEE